MKDKKFPFHKVDGSDFGKTHMTQSNPALISSTKYNAGNVGVS